MPKRQRAGALQKLAQSPRLFSNLTLCLALITLTLTHSLAAEVSIEIQHTFGAAPLRTEELSLHLPGQPGRPPISITRLSYLITEFAFLQPDGRALQCHGQAAYLNPTEGRNRFTLPGAATGDYAGVAFRIGVPPESNHRGAETWPAGHALNPLVNGLHWGWQGGFVFLALEGRYPQGDGQLGGLSYHLARDEHLMTVRLPGAWHCAGDTQLTLRFDVARILDGVTLEAEGGGDSTHSAPGDALTARLCRNVGNAFTLLSTAAVQQDGAALVRATRERPAGTQPFALRVPAGFPQPQLPEDNPLTAEGVELGKRLFSDPRLSANDTESCATCHQPEHGFSSPERVNRGIDGVAGNRHAPALFNLAWQPAFAWDGRRTQARAQALAAIQEPREMHQPLEGVVAKLAADGEMRTVFARAFGPGEITAEHLGLALEQYLLTLTAANAKFDRVVRRAERFTPEEERGFALFSTEYDPARGKFGADCFHCHGGFTFSDYAFHDTGLDKEPVDPGRFLATGREADRGKFKTPSLRNIARTAPYMHDGRFATLAEVIAHYDHGVQRSANLDPNLAKHPARGLGLSAADKQALISFLRTLTDAPEPAAEEIARAR